jgi:cell division protein FtsZ
MIEFDAPKEMSSIIKVLGVGGGGSNAVNHMYRQGIEGVDFIICNTDAQALDCSPIPTKVQLGGELTEGRGAGSIPAVGKDAAMENLDEIRELLSDHTKMLFITAGMGGGTGTGAAPVIAAIAKELNILTVGIVTIPFTFEGRKRRQQAETGIEELRENVDTLLIISNDKLRELYGNLKLAEAFGRADNILTDAAKGIAELITVTGYVNVDFEDVKTVMSNSGVAIMGTGKASGENRALEAVEMALSSPLLNDNDIRGASNILLYMASGANEIEMDEVAEITDYIQEEAGLTAEIIWGSGTDDKLDDAISITVIATGFENNSDVEKSARRTENRAPKKVVHELKEEEPKKEVVKDPVEDDGIRLVTKNTVKLEQAAPQQEETSFLNQTEEAPTQEESKVEDRKIIIHTLEEDEEPQVVSKNEHELNKEEIENKQPQINESFATKANERIARLRNLSRSFADGESLKNLEDTPAYIRRGVSLEETPAADDEVVSRYTLDSETGEMKSNNSFLHDNVD